VRGLTKHIGGITALHDVDVEVRAGTVHGLIGPNGSGKTTFLNCVSGFYGTDAGEIRVSDEPVPSRPSARARGGLGRTFQQPLLLDQLSALDNVWVGVDRHRKVGWLGYVLRTPAARREAREARTEAQRWLEAVGLGADRDTPAGRLGPGKARLVEVARALATQPRVLLMDEPAAGLSDAEMEHLEAVIREVRSAGITVVLVDHHANLVLGLCDQITVLASGEVIASGTPEEVRHDAVVINTYLGRRFLGADPEPLNA
jgi:ABC-type branched-subunit amino acid transport system ATPase component